MRIRRLASVAALACLAASIAACSATTGATSNGSSSPSGGAVGGPGHLSVLAGSELKDLEPLLPDLAKATGVHLDLKYTGTLAGAEKIAAGSSGADLAWFSNSHYVQLLAKATGKTLPQQSIMRSPVVLGVKQSVARRLGWSAPAKVTWKDIADASAGGKLRFGMTNPASSNSGFSALVGVASALSGSADAIDAGKVDEAQLDRFFAGQKLTSGSSGWLADTYAARPEGLDGIINYESVLLSLNEGGKLDEPLQLIYPQEGLVTADYPLMLVDPAAKAKWQKVTDWLRTAKVQARIERTTLRRPSVPGVALDSRFPKALLVELPFPSSLGVVDKLLTGYLDHHAPPSHAYYVLDTSGSMQGERLAQMQGALAKLTGTDTSVTGRFARFRNGERVTIVQFSDKVRNPVEVAVSGTAADDPGRAHLRDVVAGFQADGGTSLYEALERAYELALADHARDPGRLESIVLLSDGEANGRLKLDDFRRDYRRYGKASRDIRTFPVLFGDSATGEMTSVANLTGGKVFDGRTDIDGVFREIRGYQ